MRGHCCLILLICDTKYFGYLHIMDIVIENINKRDEPIQIIDDSGNVCQIQKVSDGSFMLVNCKEAPVAIHQTKEVSSDESPVIVVLL